MPAHDLAVNSVRDLNQALHNLAPDTNQTAWTVDNPQGKHAIGVGITVPVELQINGHVGYYCAGMNQHATVRINGNAGTRRRREHDVRARSRERRCQPVGRRHRLRRPADHRRRRVGALRHLDEGHRHSGERLDRRDERLHGAGRHLVVFGDAGDALGDSIYEATIFVRGKVKSLGADCIEKPMTDADRDRLAEVLRRAEVPDDSIGDFKMYGSARQLYHFHVDNIASY